MPSPVSKRFSRMLNIRETSRKRSGKMGAHYLSMEPAIDDANRRLIRFFSICLSSLAFVYTTLALRLLLERETFDMIDLLLTSARALLGVAALVVIFYPPWLARPLERQIDLMGRLFEAGFAEFKHKGKDQIDCAGDNGQLAVGTRHDPLVGIGIPGFFILQKFHAFGLFPRSGCWICGSGKAAVCSSSCAADARTIRRGHHAAALRCRRGQRVLFCSTNAGANVCQHSNGQFGLVDFASAKRAAVRASGNEFRSLRVRLLPSRSTLRQIASQRKCAESLWPQSSGEHSRGCCAVCYESVLAATGNLVHCGRRHPTAFCVVSATRICPSEWRAFASCSPSCPGQYSRKPSDFIHRINCWSAWPNQMG